MVTVGASIIATASYDPTVDLARINVPVLAITSDRDTQADPDDSHRMRGLVPRPPQRNRT